MKIKKNIKIILLVLIILIILIIAGIIIVKKIFKDETVVNPTISSAFFIKNSDNNYAVFNKDGKELTDFIYTSADGFFNGVSRVSDTSGNAGIINEKGKYVVELTTYDSVIQYGSLFKVSIDDNIYLLNYKGKKILSDSFDIAYLSTDEESILVSYNNQYILYNYLGKKIKTFDKSDDEDIIITSTDSYSILYMNNSSYIYNPITAKVIKKIENEKLYINSYEDDIFILESINEESESNIKYKVLKDDKLFDIDECSTLKFKNNNFICTYNEVSYLLDNNYKKSDLKLSSMSYHDVNNYAIEDNNSIKIVKNGKNVNTIENATLVDKGYVEEYYLIYKDNKYYFYNLSGKSVFVEYTYAYSYDSNNLAKVSDDGENYYFINTKGKKVSEEFTNSNQYKNYYIVTIEDRLGIMNNNGKLVRDCIYDKIDIIIINDVYYANLLKDDVRYIYNLDNKKQILETKNTITFYDYYLVENVDNNKYYYTLTGNKFYE